MKVTGYVGRTELLVKRSSPFFRTFHGFEKRTAMVGIFFGTALVGDSFGTLEEILLVILPVLF